MMSWGTAVLRLSSFWFAALVLAADASALPASYSALEIRGSVVDADTKQPIAGVHVIARWIVHTSELMHRGPGRPLHIMETVTDAKGEYYFPGWGPTPRPPGATLHWGSDPSLGFFKAGYRPDGRMNYSPPPENEREMSRRYSLWHWQAVPLDRFGGSLEEWASLLSGLQDSLGWGEVTNDAHGRLNDAWKHMPRMVLAVWEECLRLPSSLASRVRTLSAWGVTEPQLRALIKDGRATP